MNLLERVLTLLRANVTNMAEKSDDPEKALRQLQLDMRNQLVQVKTQVATAIAQGHKLQKQSKEKAQEAEVWYKKAENAIQQGNDEMARTALARYNDILKQAQRYQMQQKEQEQLVLTLRTALRQLEAKIAEVETTIDLLITRKRNALIQQRVYDTLSKNGDAKDKERAAKAQDAVMEAEARARALAELHKLDLDMELNGLTTEQTIEQQLHDLKAKKRPMKERPLLHEGQPLPSPLIPPQPEKSGPFKKQVEPEPVEPPAQPASSPLFSLGESEVEKLRRLLDKS